MCGFAGFLGFGGLRSDDLRQTADRMGTAIVHRGPDDSGIWSDADAEILLVHRRLSIVDLSSAGHQPMASPSGRFVIAFNGEIYNHGQLREQLESQGVGSAPVWRGHSDTETLLAAIDAWGLPETLQRCVGMFAFALWDRAERCLYLARDRLGEKPLYYGWQKSVFLFGSELKALAAHESFAGEIDRSSLALQLRHNYIVAPYSIYTGIKKLLPGSYLQIRQGQVGVLPDPVRYWDLSDIAAAQLQEPFAGSDAEALDALDAKLAQAVKGQMMADVPLGAFLSGGVDSSMVVALMQANSTRPVKTFTIGFEEASYNEAEHAKSVARHLKTEHTELYITSKEAMEVIPRLPRLYDEPFSDSSQIPTILVSQLARTHVTVALSGDGGDELFAGYDRYAVGLRLSRLLNRVPRAARGGMAALIKGVPRQAWDALAVPTNFLARTRLQNVGEKAHKLASLLADDGRSLDWYKHLVSHWAEPAKIVLGASEPPDVLFNRSARSCQMDDLSKMMLADSLTYLPGDILTKVDRAAMGVSLETRVPFLDHRVVEFAWSVPRSMKMRHGQGKWLLRQLLYRYVPPALIDRPKMGFAVPIGEWLRGPLRDWAESLLDESRLRNEGFFDVAAVRQKWLLHLSGGANMQHYLWDVLMFQAWLEQRESGSAHAM